MKLFTYFQNFFSKLSAVEFTNEGRNSGSLPPNFQTQEYWDDFWKERLESWNPPLELTHYFELSPLLIKIAQQKRFNNVLSVGCGISLETWAFAESGFNIDAIDLSTVAIDYAKESKPLFEANSNRFLQDEQKKEGGKINFIVGNILDEPICQKKYDLIISRKTIQYFFRQGLLDEVMKALNSRLNNEGVIAIHSHNAYDATEEINKWLIANDFTMNNRIFFEGDESLNIEVGKKTAWNIGSSG